MAESNDTQGVNPEDSGAEGGDLSQEELDALIAEAENEFVEAGEPAAEEAGALSQDELDKLIQSHDPAPSAKETQLFDAESYEGGPPQIEKEPIEDPAVLAALLGDDSVSQSEESIPVQEESLGSQSEVDAVVKDTNAAAELEASNAPNITEDLGLLDQDELNSLMASAKEAGADKKTSAGPAGPIVDKSVRPENYPVVEQDEGALSQDEIDALMNVPKSAPEPEASESPAEESPMDQAAIDALMAEASGTPEASEAPAEEAPLDQAAIDALMAEASSTPEPAEAPAEEAPLDQAAIDALMAEAPGTSESAEEAEVPSEEASLDQDAIDALMSGASEATDAVEAPSEEAPLDQDAIDALMAEASSEPETSEAPAEEAPLDQDAIDALMSEASGESVAAAATVESEDAGSLDQNEIDALLSGATASADEGVVESDGTDENLVEGDLDDVIDASTPPQEEIAIDSVIVDSESASAPEPAAEPLPSQPDEKEVAAVATENVAAGAEESQSIDTPAPVAEAPAQAAAVVAEDEPGGEENFVEEEVSSGKGIRLSFPVVEALKQEPYRAITGLAAGVLVALSAMLYMTANRLLPPPDLSNQTLSIAQGDVERQLALAREYVDEKEYGRAIELLDDVIPAVEGRPLSVEARYIRLEAQYHRLPDQIFAGVANALHSEIDALIHDAPLHPRRAHALFWKGRIYEKEDNVLAARVEYRELLRNESGADNRDIVLLRLGEMELNSGRPVQSARYLQQLRREHPESDLNDKAQLLLGDAYADAGDDEQARNLYIRIAQNNPGNEMGGQAFTKLGELAYESGNYDRAISDLEARLRTATSVEGNDKVTLMLAKAYRADGRLDEAQNTLKGLLDFFEESDVTPLAHIEMSKVLEESGEVKDAVRHAIQTAQRYPDNPGVLRNAGELLAKSGDVREAARALVAADAAGADDPELLLAAGTLYRRDGATEEARDVLQRLTNQYSGTEQGFLGSIELARVYYEEGRPTRAAELLGDLARTTTNNIQRLKLLGAQGDLYNDMNLPLKVAEVYAEIAGMTEEPEMLAKSALALFENQRDDEGLAIASRIDSSRLTAPRAYKLLNAQGRALLKVNPRQGVDFLEQAHTAYPTERSAANIQKLLEANLTLGRSARARAIVAELQTDAARDPLSMDQVRLERAAITLGDYLFERKDFRSAVDAYSTALGLNAAMASADGEAPAFTPLESDNQQWAAYQLANAHFKLMDYTACLPHYDQLADTTSTWAAEAQIKARAARLELRLRGEPVSETRNAG